MLGHLTGLTRPRALILQAEQPEVQMLIVPLCDTAQVASPL